MNTNILKDFLISLGFKIDEAGYRKFDAVVVGATKNIIKMGTAAEGAAASVLLYTTKIAAGLDQLYWSSQRTGATVAGIKAIGYAASQTGSSAAAAQGALESMARFMRNNPGGEGYLNRLGVQTRDASGNMRDMASIFTGVGQQLNRMPYYRANQYAQMLGIDENTLMAMRRGLGQFSGEYTAMAKAIGFNANTAAVQSNKFMTSLRDFGAMAGMARDKIGANLAGGLAGTLDNFRRQILDNFPKIEDTITRVVKGILWFGEIFGRMAYRGVQAVGDLMDWWKGLSDESKRLIGFLGLLAAAMRVLNMEFWTSPIGVITGLAIAIGLLYDDYRAWKEGGKSLIDWGKWQPDIDKAKDAITWIRDKLIELKDGVGGWQHVLEGVAAYIGGRWAANILFTVARIIKGFGPLLAVMAAIDAWKKVHDTQEEAKSKGMSIGDLLIQKMHDQSADNETSSPGAKIMGWLKGLFPGEGAGYYDAYGTVKRPQPTAAGAALLGWMQPALSQLENLYHLPAGLLKAVAIQESRGNPDAVSGAGAQGLFQLMPGTAKGLGLRGGDAFDPMRSAQAAARYLSQLLGQNGGNLNAALAAYNWGPGNIQRYGMDLMPQQTRDYIPGVRSNMPGGGFQQDTTINIYGVTDPMAAGREVAGRQTGVNSRLAHDTGTTPR